MHVPRVSVGNQERVLSSADLRFSIASDRAAELIWWQISA
jgi:hypothetical protein